MSARGERGGTLRGIALALGVAAIALVGCDSSDDDGADNDNEPTTEPGDETATTGSFADVIALGASDEPLALDAGALAADLEGLFGSTGDEPVDIEDDDTIETVGRRGKRL